MFTRLLETGDVRCVFAIPAREHVCHTDPERMHALAATLPVARHELPASIQAQMESVISGRATIEMTAAFPRAEFRGGRMARRVYVCLW